MNVLWYDTFWDYPLSGLGEYLGEKVWFVIDNREERLEKEDYTLEVKNIIANYKYNEHDKDYIGKTNDYNVYFYEDIGFDVRHKITYKLYKLPSDVLDEALYRKNLWNTMNPNECREIIKSRPNLKVDYNDLVNYKFIGIVKCNDVDWFISRNY